ncbi:MAG TPA: nuclear transport factor 2 family protein [Thermoleophilaceae bacterium]
MTQGSPDIALVERCFDAFRARDIEGLLELLTPDVRVRSLMTEPERVYYDGPQGVREWFAAILEIFPNWTPVVTDLTDMGGAMLVGMDVTASAVTSGVQIDQRLWQLTEIDGGKVSFFGFFRSEEDARAALAERRSR